MPPIPIETLVKEKIPIVSNALLVGDRAKFLSMLLTLKVRQGVRSAVGLEPQGRESPQQAQYLLFGLQGLGEVGGWRLATEYVR